VLTRSLVSDPSGSVNVTSWAGVAASGAATWTIAVLRKLPAGLGTVWAADVGKIAAAWNANGKSRLMNAGQRVMIVFSPKPTEARRRNLAATADKNVIYQEDT